MKKLTFFILCLLLLTSAAQAARWQFHFYYSDCPGGNLNVYATIDCVRQLLLFEGYAKNCEIYGGFVPGEPYNDVIFDFYWDYWCDNEDHIKFALPGWNDITGQWELTDLPSWIDANVTGATLIPSVGDPCGVIQNVYVLVNPEEWVADPRPPHESYEIIDGECDNLPGYLIGTTPISFDPCAPEGQSPFSTTPLTGTLYNNAAIILIAEPPEPNFEQLDWEGLLTSTPDSNWGRVTVDIDKPAGIYYFNLEVDGNWVIQNLSVESSSTPQTVMSFFDLGVEHGTDVSNVNYVVSFDSSPQFSMPAGTSGSATVENLEYQIGTEDEIDHGPTPSGPKTKPSTVTVTSSAKLPNLDKFKNQPQGKNQCAPGAISNSLKYLQARGKISSTLPTSISDVGGVIGTDANGTPSDWPDKKKKHYKNHVTTRYITAPLTLAKLQDLMKELKRGQDIEVDLKGHVEVLAGVRLKSDGTVDFDLFDDNQKDANSDPMHTSPLCGDATTDYIDGMELEKFVIECPKEPGPPSTVTPYGFFDRIKQWLKALESRYITPMTSDGFYDYIAQWHTFCEEPNEPYPDGYFSTPELYVWEGGGAGGYEPNDEGLVMAWNIDGMAGENISSAWKLTYGEDPDFRNCLITVTVTAPQFGASGNITQVSLGLQNSPSPGGPVRAWYWNCGSAGSGCPIIWNTPTTITIDTSKIGVNAATPVASSYVNNPAFNLSSVDWIIVDENGNWIGGPSTAPGPGGWMFMWNYWHWMMVTPKTTVEKGVYPKWNQPPVVADPNGDPPIIIGWDESSDYNNPPMIADDWLCTDDRPVTDIHWWGSFLGWSQPYLPPVLPKAFHIGIWTDIPDTDPGDPTSFSHPGELIWEIECTNWVWNFSGYDRDPRMGGDWEPNEPGYDYPMDTCFQFNQLLSQDEWFVQELDEDNPDGTVYWLSIAPIYDPWDYDDPNFYPWGWKTRRPEWNDDAVRISMTADGTWPPTVGSWFGDGQPIKFPEDPPEEAYSWDVAFQLTTNERPAIPCADLNRDGIVNFVDVAILAKQWLQCCDSYLY